ncbi:MAG: sodium:proton antiporter [Terricaulis sp.]
MNGDSLEMVELLAVAMIVAIATRRLSLPYTVGLVLVGVGIAFLNVDIGGTLTHDFIFYLILPPLLFEAALVLNGRELWENAGVVSVLATLGTLIAAAIVAVGMNLLLHWPLPAALIFGALIAATDPVAVIAMFKDNGVSGRLRTLMESESLFNDAAAAILFALALAFAVDGHFGGPVEIAQHLLLEIGGGVLIGAAVGGAAVAIAWRSTEHIVEVALSVLAAYGAFLIADGAGASGILATVVAGLIFGGFGLRGDPNIITHKGKEFAEEFWDFAAFLANSAVFPLIGVAVGGMPLNASIVLGIGVAIVLVLAGRALTIYPLSLPFSAGTQRLSLPHQHILWWGGLRGALALALALSLPETLPFRQEIELTTFGVVAFSIVVQGLSMPWLLRRLGIVDRQRA